MDTRCTTPLPCFHTRNSKCALGRTESNEEMPQCIVFAPSCHATIRVFPACARSPWLEKSTDKVCTCTLDVHGK
eukprot:923926-Pleurochrysis_carterae.AAC.1